MLTRHTFARLIPILAIASLLLIETMLLPPMTSAQNIPFVADTLIPPRVFDFRADGWLSDFGFDSSSTICFVKHFDEQGNDYSFVIRHNDYGVIVDTLYLSASPPSRDEFFIFDAKGQAMALGFGPSLVDNRFFVKSDDAGRSWDTVDIGDTAYYDDLKIAKTGTWLLKSSSPLVGWRYVTRDTAYWIFQNRLTESWVQVVANDSLLLFYADNGCGRGNVPDTGFFQFLRLGEVADDLTPVVVPASTPVSLPVGTECPRIRFIGSNGERLWFKREWGISYPDTQTNAFPTEFYSYNLRTGKVQFESFIRHPRWPVNAILYAHHIFVAVDSQLVVRHVDATSSSPFIAVPGVDVGLGNLQVHNGALYGSQSSGLIMKISQVSSASSSSVANSNSFTAEIRGGEIVMYAVEGAISSDVRLELFDLQGRRLAESSIASGSREGRLSAPLAPGVFFLRCRGSETSTTLRIFVP